MDYRSEFPDFDRILDIDLIAAHGLVDCSWHNDAVPSFERIVGDYRIVLWVNYADRNLREFADAAEYVINVQSDRGSDDDVASRGAVTLDEALDLVDHFTRRAASGDVYVLQHWINGDWSDMYSSAFLDEDDADEALDRWFTEMENAAHYRGEHVDINRNNYRVIARTAA